MIVWRRWIFPILMVLVCGVIAASLAKLAFFEEPTSIETPHAAIQDPVVAIERGTVVNSLDLRGTISRDENVIIRSPQDGEIVTVHVTSGQSVEQGQVLFTAKRIGSYARFDIIAPEAGQLGDVQLLAGQSMSLGGEVVTLSPNRFHMLSTVEPVQLYRLIDAPSEGTVTIQGGPAPFGCLDLTTKVADDGTTSVRCKVPADQTVFPGLPAELSITIGSADDALLVPVTAVLGGSGSGKVWLDHGDSGEPEERQVTLGINDGSFVEVLDGLSESDQIRQFVPGFMAPVEEFCYEVGPGEMYCESGVSW